jgi:hypothetical protein
MTFRQPTKTACLEGKGATMLPRLGKAFGDRVGEPQEKGWVCYLNKVTCVLRKFTKIYGCKVDHFYSCKCNFFTEFTAVKSLNLKFVTVKEVKMCLSPRKLILWVLCYSLALCTSLVT